MTKRQLPGAKVNGEAAQFPCGCKVEKPKLIPVPELAEVVRRKFKRFVETQSPKQIAYELNQEGILTNQSKEWSVHHIYRILNNYTYIGNHTRLPVPHEQSLSRQHTAVYL